MKDLRRQCKFVTMIISQPHQTTSPKEVVLVAGHCRCSLPISTVKQLISQGVLSCSNGTYSATTDARSWLKRLRLILLKQDQPIITSCEQKPIMSENDIIVRLSRKSKGEKEAFLAAHHVLVANRVSALIAKSQLRPSITQNLSVLRQGGKASSSGLIDLSDMAIDCRKRLEQLVLQLPKDCAGVVVDVCGFEKGLQQVEFERSWPRRSAKLVLRMGLDHAAEFWNVAAFAQGPN